MNLADATRYARENVQLVKIPKMPHAAGIQCIDGRSTRGPHEIISGQCHDSTTSIAFPGGALGLPAAVMAAINVELLQRWEYENPQLYTRACELLGFREIIDFAESYFGGMSCHTDDEHANDPLACRGCGHAMGLVDNKRYGLGTLYAPAFRNYAAELRARVKMRDRRVTLYSYSGPHREEAVMRVQSRLDTKHFIALRPTDGERGVFIVNEVMGIRILRDFTGSLYEHLKDSFEALGVSRGELCAHVESTYWSHVRTSATRLAKGKPVYDVTVRDDGTILVSKSSLRF
jgi:hypothetical protein